MLQTQRDAMLGGSDFVVVSSKKRMKKKRNRENHRRLLLESVPKPQRTLHVIWILNCGHPIVMARNRFAPHFDETGRFADSDLRKIVFDAYKQSRAKIFEIGSWVRKFGALPICFSPLRSIPEIADGHVEESFAEGGPGEGLILGMYCGNQKSIIYLRRKR